MNMETARRVARNKDVVSAVLIAIAAGAFFVTSLRLSFGSPMDMGPGFFPRIVSALLFCLAVGIGVRGATEALSDGRDEPLRLPLRPIVSVFAAMFLFVLTLRGFGLIVASALLVLVAGVAPRDRRWREVAISAAVLSVTAGFLFVYGLGLQAPLLPWR
ncbi:MAG: hypothetical protein DI556_15280 [Rhodovulum sulfidophilum]|uniref:DUF1468 domain-containing protein n=1 Tax=Rhodovulum sulfidophilum TaxID=35806 RepID=A0A2W5N3Y9_RHOSU|nr:MAG: hypothetical protein DI556_15280 [Rhodovulum sulfidophilum]